MSFKIKKQSDLAHLALESMQCPRRLLLVSSLGMSGAQNKNKTKRKRNLGLGSFRSLLLLSCCFFSSISLVISSQRRFAWRALFCGTVYQLLRPCFESDATPPLAAPSPRAVTGRVSSQAAEMIRRNFPLCNQLLCRGIFCMLFICAAPLLTPPPPTTTLSETPTAQSGQAQLLCSSAL